MKYVLVIGDGMADAPLKQLDGKTPLEALVLDAFDRAAGCEYGRVRTVPQGLRRAAIRPSCLFSATIPAPAIPGAARWRRRAWALPCRRTASACG